MRSKETGKRCKCQDTCKKMFVDGSAPTPNSSVRSWRRICWMLMEREQLIAAPAFFMFRLTRLSTENFCGIGLHGQKLLLFQLQCTANAPGTHFCLAISILMMYNIVCKIESTE